MTALNYMWLILLKESVTKFDVIFVRNSTKWKFISELEDSVSENVGTDGIGIYNIGNRFRPIRIAEFELQYTYNWADRFEA